MNNKSIILALLLLAASVLLIACSGNEPAQPAAPAESIEVEQVEEAAVLPTAEPVVSENLYVTDVNEIVGTWVASADLGIFVAVITPDGLFRVATSSEDLEKGSTDSWQLTFEEDRIKASGYALCIGDVGYYLAEIKPDGTLKFITISDPCTGRIRKMDRSLPGRLTPYDLVFYPVE